jgi:hypothetical protein
LIIQNIRSPDTLVMLKLIVDLNREFKTFGYSADGPSWGQLDAILAPLTGFERLELGFVSRTRGYQRPPEESRYDVYEIRKGIPAQLPRCFAKGIIAEG